MTDDTLDGIREHVLNQQQAVDAKARYVQGYRQQPETDEEVALAHQISSAVLMHEP